MSAMSQRGGTGQLLLPGQAAAPPGPVDLTAMYVMHHAFRRDRSAFKAAVARTPVDDRVTWQALAVRWGQFADILHKHHVGEDAGLRPLLLERADAAGDAGGRATLEAMESEHGEIGSVLRSCAAGFERLAACADADARDALEVRVVAVGELLGRHLAREEREVMALVQRYLVHTDWESVAKEHFRPAYGPRQTSFVVCWVLHQLPAEEFHRVRVVVGPHVTLLWRLLWRRGFERRERQAFRHD